MSLDRHYTQSQAARLLGVSVSTIRRHVRRGRQTQGREGIWPVATISGQLRLIPERALRRWVTQA